MTERGKRAMMRAMRAFIAVLGLLTAAGLPALAAAADAKGTTIRISRSECARIVKHQSSADYKPGVNVRGKKVKDADAPGAAPIKLPETISIDIGFYLDKKYGIGTGNEYKGAGSVGKVTVKGDKVYFNDQPLEQRDQAAIAEACQKTYGQGK